MNYVERQEIIAKSPISFPTSKRLTQLLGYYNLVNGIAMLALTIPSNMA